MDSGSRLALLTRWCRVALRSLGEARAEIDALNVFPVPDGDTGTNLYLTFEAAVAALDEAAADDLDTALQSMSRGALLGARGSSGVIVSQLLRAASEQVAEAGPPGDEIAAGDMLAAALRRAADAGYAAVAEPVEGTILTVARAAAAAAGSAAERAEGPGAVITAAAAAAWEALSRTPEQLERLREAGVVDAGGRGLCVLLDAAVTALTGRRPPVEREAGRRAIPIPAAPACAQPSAGGGPAYEVMYLLDAADERIETFKSAWEPVGDSIVIVGGNGLWNCHIHTDDIGAAIEVALDAGRPRNIRVTDLATQVEEERWVRQSLQGSRPQVTTAVVAVGAGEGVAAALRSLGAQEVVAGGQSANPSTREILDAVEATDADEVVVLPNNKNVVPVADGVPELASKPVRVVPTTGLVGGLAALLAYDPALDAATNAGAMAAATEGVVSGEVTRSVRDASTPVGEVRAGDWLGLAGDQIVLSHPELGAAATALLERLVGASHELVTVIEGDGASATATEAVTRWLADERPGVEVQVHDWGHPHAAYIFSIE